MENNNALPTVEVRLVRPTEHLEKEKITTPEKIAERFANDAATFTTEVVRMICMTHDGRPFNEAVISVGNESSAYLPMKKVLQIAILSNACHVIMLHNHPDALYPFPSRNDDKMAYKLYSGLYYCDISLFDFIVTSSTGAIYSFRHERRGPFSKHCLQNMQYPAAPGGLIRA